MDDDDEPESYFKLIQWRSLGCLISLVVTLWLLVSLFDRFANRG